METIDVIISKPEINATIDNVRLLGAVAITKIVILDSVEFENLSSYKNDILYLIRG